MANAYDAQTAWQTRNGIAGPFNLLLTSPSNSNSTSGSETVTRGGYTPVTPKNNASNATNSDLPGNHGTQTLPHNFAALGTEQGSGAIATGIYYKLIPKTDKASKHQKITSPIWFPVTGDAHVDFTFSHQWDQADNLGKKFLAGVANKALGPDFGDLAFKQGQHFLGGGLYVSGCSVYNSSSPPTITIATKLFSTDGNGKILNTIERLRWETHPRRGGGASEAGKAGAALGGAAGEAMANSIVKATEAAGGKAGSIDHPGWWDVEVVSFAGGGAATVAKMSDMICTGLKITMYSPWIGKEPSIVEIRMDLQHAYPGLAESMSFGG